MNTQNFKTVKIDGLDIFYREAGDKKQTKHPPASWVPFVFTLTGI